MPKNKTSMVKKTPDLKKKLLEKNKSLFLDLLKIHAYYGDTYLRNHYTQNSFVYAYRNDYSLYNLHTSILHLKRAFHFLQKQKSKNLVFVGSPSSAQESISLLFHKLKITFFPSAEWPPGFISKKAYNQSKILIIYDIFTNQEAKSEAFKAAYPIVGFLSIHGDVNGVDFPISLSLENCGIWYYCLWKSYFQIKIHETRS
jgi:ribosomal protein S2